MDLDALRTFVAVVRRGSFAAVARDRDVDPSSVSRAVARLEGELGVRLLHRTTRQLTPTEAGEAYAARVGPVVEELDAAAARATDAAAGLTGTLRVASPVSFALLNVVPLLPAFAARHPALSFDLVLTDAPVDLLAERVDVALQLGPLADSSLVARRLATLEARAVAAPSYLARRGRPVTPADLAEHDGLHLDVPGFSETWRFRDPEGFEARVAVPARLRTSNAIALKAGAVAGMGVTVQGRWIVGRELRRGDLVDLFPDHEATAAAFGGPSVWVVYPTRLYVPAKVRAFVAFLLDAFSDGPPWDALGSGDGSVRLHG